MHAPNFAMFRSSASLSFFLLPFPPLHRQEAHQHHQNKKMQRLMYGLTCLLGMTASVYGQGGEKGTPGVTPGEPGLGDHGQGMKGLGGGMVEVLCAPTQVAIGQPFTVNVHYMNDIKRPVDVHVSVLKESWS